MEILFYLILISNLFLFRSVNLGVPGLGGEEEEFQCQEQIESDRNICYFLSLVFSHYFRIGPPSWMLLMEDYKRKETGRKKIYGFTFLKIIQFGGGWWGSAPADCHSHTQGWVCVWVPAPERRVTTIRVMSSVLQSPHSTPQHHTHITSLTLTSNNSSFFLISNYFLDGK